MTFRIFVQKKKKYFQLEEIGYRKLESVLNLLNNFFEL